MSLEKFDPDRWVDRLAGILASLDKVHKPFLHQYRLYEPVTTRNCDVPGFPLDDAQALYSLVRYNTGLGKEASIDPLRKTLDCARHALLSHPVLECVAVTGRNIGENDFYIQILNSGRSISASDLIAGLMARAADLSEDRFKKASRELHAFLSPAKDGEIDNTLGDLDEGCHILPFYGLTVTERIDLGEGMAILPCREILRFLDEEFLQRFYPREATYHSQWCGGVFVQTFRWRPAFRQRGSIDDPRLEPVTLFPVTRQFLDLLSVSHKTPLFPLALISGCVDQSASRLLGCEKQSPGIYENLSTGFFSKVGITEYPVIKKKELNDVLEVFKSRQGSWFSRFESYLSRLSEALSRNGRFFDEVRIMDVAIALEGMYELPKYTKKQALAERISRFLGASEEDRRNLEESVKRFYDARSEIVHGDSMGTSPFRNDATFVTGFTLARRSLFKLLIEGPPKDWTKWKVLDN